MTRRLVHLVLGLALSLGAHGARAQAPALADDPRPLDTLVVPGGFVALQQAMPLQGRAEDWRTIPLAIELSFGAPDGLRFVRTINAYAAVLRRLHDQAIAVSADRTLSLGSREKRRAQVDDLLETLGLAYDDGQKGVRSAADRNATLRAAALERAGLPMNDLAARLNAGETVTLVTHDDEAPLPLGMRFWEQRFEPSPPPHDLLWAILSSVEMSSLYYGLLGFDEATLRAIAADPRIQASLIRHALVLPTVVPALRLQSGRVVTPGGSEVVPLWEELVGERIDKPAEFVNKLLRIDQGRLAHFYRTASVLPPQAAAWLTGNHDATGQGHERFRRTYQAFAAALGEWQPNGIVQSATPGPADVLFSVATRQDGTIAGPPWSELWRRIFESDGWPDDPVRETGRIDAAQLLDPATLLQLLCPQRCDPERIATYALMQREFPQPTAEMAPSLLAAARARSRYPALALAIERMRLADASVYAKLGALANRLEGLGQPSRSVALVQLQSAVALLDRWRDVGAPAAAIRDGAGALAALTVSDSGFDGGVVRWLTQLFAAAADETVDSVAIRRLAGSGWQSPSPPFEWEGLAYRVDVATVEEQRIRSVRERFSSNTLDTAAALVRLADGIPEAVASNRVDDFAAALGDAAGGVQAFSAFWTGSSTPFDGIGDIAREAGDKLHKVRPLDRDRIQEAMQSLRRAADVIAADALATLVYSLAIQDPDGPFTMSREYPRRHHLHPTAIGGQRAGPWQLAEERAPERGIRHISGSLLGLEAGVPQLAARRLAAVRPDQEPNMAAMMSLALQRDATLARPWSVAAEDLAAIEQAQARGAQVVEQWTNSAALERSLSAAGIVGVRAGWLRWSVARGRSVTTLVTLEELVRLSGWTPSSRFSWGVAAGRYTCLCLTMPELSWELRGEPRQPEAAWMVLEPVLRTAIEIDRRHLPAALAPGVLALLMTDLSERSVLPHHSDLRAIADAVRRIPAHRFDDYIAAVVARGPVARVSASSGGQ